MFMVDCFIIFQTFFSTSFNVPVDPVKERGLIRTLLRRKHNQRISGRDPVMLVEEYISWHYPQLIVTAHKFEDAAQRNHQRVSLAP